MVHTLHHQMIVKYSKDGKMIHHLNNMLTKYFSHRFETNDIRLQNV